MLDSLSDRFDKVLSAFRRNKKLSESNIQEGINEIRLALLDADVNYDVVKNFIQDIQQEAMGEKVIQSVSPTDQFIKVVHDKLVEILGTNKSDIKLRKYGIPVIMLVGLQGSGKTTTCAKLGKMLAADRRVLLVGADTYRPAAKEQLRVLAEQAGIGFFGGSSDKQKPQAITKEALRYATKNNFHAIILDTAGRLQIDKALMSELADLKKITKPDEILFVSDAMAGQNVVEVVSEFDNKLDISGVILTKFDSDTRGGAALSIKTVTGKSIKFVGMGEKLDDLEAFYPERIAGRILGKGDIVSFVEKAQQAIDDDAAERMAKKLEKHGFDFNDFLEQLKTIKKMGSLRSLLEMIPGVGKMIKGVDMDDNQLVKVEAMIQSMTPKERKNYKIISPSRRKRIANGSGTTVRDVTELLKRFDMMQKMMKKFKGGMADPGGMMKKMGLGDLDGEMPAGLGDLAKGLPGMDKGNFPDLSNFK